MALDPNYLQSLPQNLVDMYGLVEIDILTDMARRINTYDFFIPSAQHQMQKLQELGGVQEEIIAKLSALTGRTQEEIVELLTEAGEVAIEDDVEYYKAAEVYEPKKVNTEALYSALNAGLLQTQQAFFNITGTTANTATKQFERALDRAWTQINTGGMDYKTAIRRAIEGLSDDGIGAVEYPSGRIDTLETAVRRAVVTGANQTAIKTQEVLADELEIDLVETTAHGGARPEHAKWQGQVFSRNGRKTIDGVTYEDLRKATGYGKASGLCGVNCRHSFHPYVPGTARTWSEKELEALEEKKVEYNGKKLTEYEANQVQRGMEREIRKLKRKAAALEAAGLDASDVKRDLAEGNKIYSDFTKQTGIRRQPDRLKVAKGTDITGPSGNRPQNSENSIENAGNSGKIKLADINKMVTPYERKVLDTVPKKEGFFDFAAHGAPDKILYGSSENKMTAREVAKIIRHNEAYHGQKVRLLSCSTGSSEDGFAQQLANALGVEIEAPNDILFVFPNGKMKIGKDGTGKMVTFKPYGKE